MNPNVPVYISLLLIVITAALLYFIYYAQKYALNKLEAEPRKKKTSIALTFALLTAWLAASAVIAFNGTLLDFAAVPPKLMLVVIPPALAVIYISSSARVSRMLGVIPRAWLVYIQAFRIFIELGLWLLFINNIIPVQMTFEGLNYDVLIGLSALLIGYYCLSARKWPRIAAVLWNIAGILMVTNIFIIALLSAPGPLRQFYNEPANTMVAYFPFVWLPAFIVPFAYLMHILSIKQILKSSPDAG
jgi:hypothetical protein